MNIRKSLRDKVDVLLVTLPPWDVETPPVGLGYLAEYLVSKEININVFDFNIDFFNKFKDKYAYLWKMHNQRYWFNKNKFNELFKIIRYEVENCVNKIINSKIEIVCFSVANPKERITIEVIKRIKRIKPNIKIILGGPACNYEGCRYLFTKKIPELIDCYVVGEGEETLYELIKAIKIGKDIKKIKGVIVYNNGKCSKLVPREPVNYKKINIFSTYSQFDLSKYTNHKMITVEWSRGCIGNCSFCPTRRIWKGYRTRTPESIVSEIKYHVKKNNIRDFSVCDSTINGDLKNLEKVCDLIIESGLKIRWSGLAIPRKMSHNLLKKMKEAGCYRLEYGVESGSNKILKLMRKINRVKESEEVLRITHQVGIKTVIFLIIGFPGETKRDFNQTVDFIRKNKDYIDLVRSVNGLYIQDGTYIKDNPKKYGVIQRRDDKTGYDWYTNDGNNAEERNKKVKKVILLLDELRIKYELDSSSETEETNNSDKKEIILVNLPPWGINNPPLGLACLSEYLKSNNVKVKIFDFNIDLYNKVKERYSNLWHVENKNYWSNDTLLDNVIRLISNEIEGWVNKIICSNIGIIAFSVVDPKERLAIHIIKMVKEKKPNIKVILGGPACATPMSRKFFEERIPELIDAYIVGEGEKTLSEVINKINQNLPLDKVQGVIVFKNNKENNLIPKELLKPEEIPSPTYNDFNLSQYSEGNNLLMEWSRGCIANCAFCVGRLMLGKYRFKEPKKIVDEIKYYVREKGITNFTIVDNLINGNLKKLEETCDLIIRDNLKINWNCEGIGVEMPLALLKKMKKAGCKEFQIGVESGSEFVLRRMRKPYTAKSAESLVRIAKKAGLKTEIFLMIGFPGETESEFNKTLEFIKRNKDYIDLIKSINILHLIAGTDVMDNHKKYGIIVPKEDYHYKWYTKEGNNMDVRNARVKKVISLINNLGIPFLETNVMEGKDKESNNLKDINNIITLELAKSINYDKQKTSIETKDKERIKLEENKKKVLPEVRNFSSKNKIGVLLVILPPWGNEYPPMSLAYLSSYLRSRGITTQVLDANIDFFSSSNNEMKELWNMSMTPNWNTPEKFQILKKRFHNIINEYVNKVSKVNAKVVCFSVNLANILITKEFIKRLKVKSNSKIIIGGPSVKNKESRKKFYGLVDYFVIGQGEEILYQIYNNIISRKNDNIHGSIRYYKGIESDYIPKKELDINTLPFPTYEEFNFSKYKMDQLPFLLSRGCIRRCLYCNDSSAYLKFSHRDPKQIFNEVYHHYKRYNIRCFEAHDLLINGDLTKLEEFCDLLIKSNINIEWHGQAVIRKMPIILLKKMKKSGLKSLVLGLESASDIVLKKMRRPFTEKMAQNLINELRIVGIDVYVNIIVGIPGEDEKEFNKTMKFLEKNKENIISVTSLNTLTLYKSTDLYKLRDKFNIIVENENENSQLWYDNKGNTFELRMKRIHKMSKFLKKIKLPLVQSNQPLEELMHKNNINDKTRDKELEKERINVTYKKNKMVKNIIKKMLNIKNIFNGVSKTEQIHKNLVPTPKYVTIDLTNSCNLNCIGCWTYSLLLKDKEASKKWGSQMIPPETLRKLINDLHEIGTERIRLTGGGEPFMHPNIFEVIKLIKEKNIACDITTNFTLLNKEKIKELFELNIDELVVSIWAGDAETYVKTHPNQTRETFERIRENLRFIAQYKEKVRKGPKVIMANVLTKINYDKVDQMASFATNVSLDELYFTLIDPIKGKTDCLLLDKKERKILLNKLKKAKRIIKEYNKKSKIHKIYIDDINRFVNKIRSKGAKKGKYDLGVINKPCYIGYIFARILANGDVVPCCRAVMYPIGNINKKSFKDIWFSDEYDKFRERALYENKLNLYFKKIGCFMTCDNIIHNKEIENRRL